MTSSHPPRNLENVVLLAGGVGGAKMARGLAEVLPPGQLTIIANTADDFEHLGLAISPDLDTLMYTLADINNPQTGWGRAGETWQAMETLTQLGGPSWFNLGDKDLGCNLLRTHWLAQGEPLSAVTAKFCRALGLQTQLLPMSDAPVRTIVHTDRGVLGFQNYFVEHRCQPTVEKLVYQGADSAPAGPGVVAALTQADLIVFAPSNPLLSLDPILAIPPIAEALTQATAPKVAVSPIIGGQAVKGPAAKLMAEFGFEVSALGVARYLRPQLTAFVCDTLDQALEPDIAALGLATCVTETLIPSLPEQSRLARTLLDFARQI